MPILFAEAAASFEELTLTGQAGQLKAQVPDAWPNLFREARFLSAVDFVQADRLRRKFASEMARVFSEVDLLLVPSLRDEMLTIYEFHRASVAHAARGIRASVGGAQRLGARSGEPAAQVHAAASRAARHDADRTLVRRRDDHARRRGDGAGVQRRGRAAAGLLEREIVVNTGALHVRAVSWRLPSTHRRSMDERSPARAIRRCRRSSARATMARVVQRRAPLRRRGAHLLHRPHEHFRRGNSDAGAVRLDGDDEGLGALVVLRRLSRLHGGERRAGQPLRRQDRARRGGDLVVAVHRPHAAGGAHFAPAF